MINRGVFFGIDAQTLKQLKSTKGDPKRRDFIGVLEEEISAALKQDTDKAWYFLDVGFITSHLVPPPACITVEEMKILAKIFTQGKQMHKAELYIINFLDKSDLATYLEVLTKITETCLQEMYQNMPKGWFKEGIYQNTEAQFQYIWTWFQRLVVFFQKMKEHDLHILFTVQYY